ETRVGDLQLAVGHRPCHRLDQEACRLSARPPVPAEVVTLEEVEHLEQGQAGGRRSSRSHLQIPVTSSNRLGHVDLVPGEVIFGDEATISCEVRGDRVSYLPAIENVRPLAGEPLESPGEVSLHHDLANLIQAAVM